MISVTSLCEFLFLRSIVRASVVVVFISFRSLSVLVYPFAVAVLVVQASVSVASLRTYFILRIGDSPIRFVVVLPLFVIHFGAYSKYFVVVFFC